MPLSRNGYQPILNVVALVACALLASCSTQKPLESSQSEEPPPVAKEKGRSTSHDASTDDDELDAGSQEADKKISTQKKQLDASANSSDASAAEPPKKPAKDSQTKSEPEASKKREKSPQDAGASPDESRGEDKPNSEPSKTEQPKQEDAAECSRDWLRERANAYLQSLTSGDTMALRIHPSFRYTENGRDEQLGGGAWLRRGQSLFSRHVLDENSCSTLTQAVMDGLTGRFSFGVRLRYVEGQLLEAEAQVVPELLAATDLDAVIPMGDDPFVAEVPNDKRMSREQLFDIAQRYFDSVTGIAMLPPATPECRRLQNGLPLGNGTCTEPPGTARFEQQRFQLADEPNGIVTATVLYENHIGFYLLKIADNQLQNIIVIGGATSQATGW